MLALTANENIKIECITCWEECNTRIFQRIVKEWEPEIPLADRSALKLFCILTGANFTALLKNTDENLELAIYQCTAFVYNQPMDFKDGLPKVLKLRGKLITVPKKLSSMSIEQNMHIRKALQTCRSLEELISLACAVYLQPQVDGTQYSHDKALELEKEILDMPIWQTFAVGFFYLSKLNNSGKHGLLSWNLLKQRLTGNVQQLQRRLRLTGSMRSMISPS